MQFCREFKFERLGAFAYSEEDGTPAAEYPDQVEQAVRDLRRDQLIAQQQQISEDFRRVARGQRGGRDRGRVQPRVRRVGRADLAGGA